MTLTTVLSSMGGACHPSTEPAEGGLSTDGSHSTVTEMNTARLVPSDHDVRLTKNVIGGAEEVGAHVECNMGRAQYRGQVALDVMPCQGKDIALNQRQQVASADANLISDDGCVDKFSGWVDRPDATLVYIPRTAPAPYLRTSFAPHQTTPYPSQLWPDGRTIRAAHLRHGRLGDWDARRWVDGLIGGTLYYRDVPMSSASPLSGPLQASVDPKPSLVIGFDTEFAPLPTGPVLRDATDGEAVSRTTTRVVASYQMSVFFAGRLYQRVFLPDTRLLGHETRPSVSEIIALALWGVPLGLASGDLRLDDRLARVGRETRSGVVALPVTLASHFAIADMTALRDTDPLRGHVADNAADTSHVVARGGFRGLSHLGGGYGSRENSRVEVTIDGVLTVVSFVIRDSLSLAPAGKSSLAAIGDLIGRPKLDSGDWEARTAVDWLRSDPVGFLAYAINDADLVVDFLGHQWGYNREPPTTLASSAAKLAAQVIAAYRPEDTDAYGRFPWFTGRKPNGDDGDSALAGWRHAWAEAFHGGLNDATFYGWFDAPTVDLDIEGAYVTAMSCVLDPDIREDSRIHLYRGAPQPLTLDLFTHGVLTPLVATVDFCYPPGVMPGILVVVDGVPIRPRSAERVTVAAPELWAALKNGATISARVMWRAGVLARGDGTASRALSEVSKVFAQFRVAERQTFGKGSLPELMAKEAGNSVYGKVAQSVAERRSWDARQQRSVDIGPSRITSAYHAAMITSLIRVLIQEAQRDCAALGRAVISTTTDGYITDASLSEVETAAALGLNALFRRARAELLDDPTAPAWSQKHQQTGVLSARTRSNAAEDSAGVLAKGGVKLAAAKGSAEERDQYMGLLLDSAMKGRPIENAVKEPTPLSEVTSVENRIDFDMRIRERSITTGYDGKHRPDWRHITSVAVETVDGLVEIASVPTVPWVCVAEFKRMRVLLKETDANGKRVRPVILTPAQFSELHHQWVADLLTLNKNAIARVLVAAAAQGLQDVYPEDWVMAMCGASRRSRYAWRKLVVDTDDLAGALELLSANAAEMLVH